MTESGSANANDAAAADGEVYLFSTYNEQSPKLNILTNDGMNLAYDLSAVPAKFVIRKHSGRHGMYLYICSAGRRSSHIQRAEGRASESYPARRRNVQTCMERFDAAYKQHGLQRGSVVN